jgi:phage terminase large subunit
MGGAGSGKSVSLADMIIIDLESPEKNNWLVLRKVATSLKDSCYNLLLQRLAEFDWLNEFKITKQPMEIISKRTGNRVIFYGLDDIRKLKSIAGITKVWGEEVEEFEMEDFKQLNLRLRGNDGVQRQYFYTFNPVDESLDIKKYIDLRKEIEPDKIYELVTTYKDNKFLDKEYIEALENLAKEDLNWYNIYAKGIWGKSNIEGRCYKKFTEDNISDYKFDKNLPIIVCCDFNVNPCKWALIQNAKGNDYVFDEIVLKDTDTESMTKELLNRYQADFYFYGDYSGTFRSTSSPTTDYDIIRNIIPKAVIRIQPNPLQIDRINAMNYRLCNDLGQRRLYIHSKCTHTKEDLSKVKYEVGKRVIDKEDEKKGLVHISDAIGYYINYEYSLKGKPNYSRNL